MTPNMHRRTSCERKLVQYSVVPGLQRNVEEV